MLVCPFAMNGNNEELLVYVNVSGVAMRCLNQIYVVDLFDHLSERITDLRANRHYHTLTIL